MLERSFLTKGRRLRWERTEWEKRWVEMLINWGWERGVPRLKSVRSIDPKKV